jgi:hypothetical protein
MALISPGLQLSVTDESQYVPGAVGSTPLVILATAQDKTANGSYADGTSKTNAGKLQVFTSQRELVSALGYPVFKQSASGTPLHGTALNEYGLMAAYSTLATANRVYAIRADIDLNELEPTSNRPIGDAEDGTYWLDLAESYWGIYEWDAENNSYTEKQPIAIVSEDDTEYNSSTGRYEPLASIGQIGDYAITFDRRPYRTYYKDSINVWRLLGDLQWQNRAHATVTGTATSPEVTVDGGTNLTINDLDITFTGAGDLAQVVADINDVFNVDANTRVSPYGVHAEALDGKLVLFGSDDAMSDGSNKDGIISITGTATALTELGLIAGEYHVPQVHFGSYVDVPGWATDDPRPTGSVYLKTSAVGGGANISFKQFKASSGSWTTLAAPVYTGEAAAIYGLDPITGGFATPVGTVFARCVSRFNDPTTQQTQFDIFIKKNAGATVATRTPTAFAGGTFQVSATESGTPGVAAATTITVANGSSIADFASKFVIAFAEANIPEVYARVESNGNISVVHSAGGNIWLKNVSGSALSSAGFTSSNTRTDGVNLILSNYVFPTSSGINFEISFDPPYTAPADGTLWYYADPTQVDIMINDGVNWRGYRNVSTDARGFDLSSTDPLGPIITPSKPKYQNDGSTPVADGDLWLDTSDLENFPKLYRSVNGKWVSIDNTDRISQNGIVFADARWDGEAGWAEGDESNGSPVRGGGTTDPISGDMPSVVDLLTSDYVDPDAPNPRLYPRGTLLFNTRRSGFNVKKYVSDYFTLDSFPDSEDIEANQNGALPTVAGAWVSVSGLKDSGAPYMGAQAQRNMVVKAMRSAVDGNTQVREDQFFFNLIAAPGFPEVITNMVALNNDRKNTAFVIGDTPMTLPTDSIAVANWANNVNGDGLSTADPYLGIFYPAGLTNDIDGNTIVVPASHMMLRTFIRNDNVSYPWFAPAGTRRGLIDNASDIGYIDAVSGGFVRNGINQGMRDALYENRVNPMTILPGVGLVAWGQKTRNPVASSMDRINVARLVNYIRTILASVGNGFLFEPNDKITRDQIKSIIEGAMNDLVAKRGIYDYLVVCDGTNNTPDRIARNELYVDIAIEPMKAVEFIYIPIRLKNPGDIAKLG